MERTMIVLLSRTLASIRDNPQQDVQASALGALKSADRMIAEFEARGG
jgi:hypothetical protein